MKRGRFVFLSTILHTHNCNLRQWNTKKRDFYVFDKKKFQHNFDCMLTKFDPAQREKKVHENKTYFSFVCVIYLLTLKYN